MTHKRRLKGINRNWVKVFIAAFFEVFWVIGLKHANSAWEWLGTAISIFLSFYLMIMAGRKLPVGTVYAVFVGMGTDLIRTEDIYTYSYYTTIQ